MLKERILEVFEFTKSESPYRKANKGWINKDIFLDLSPSPDKFEQKNEAAKITFFWSPINSLLSNIFLIIIVSSILVFTSLSFAKGRFDFNLFNISVINDVVSVEENKSLNIRDLIDIDSTNSTIKENLDTKQFAKINTINSLDDDLMKEDQEKINKKLDNQDSLIKESKINKDIKILENKKSKSNFF